MSSLQEQFRQESLEAWSTYMDALEKSLNDLEADIEEAADMTQRCTAEWCTATEHVIDEINDALFNISEPRWAPEAQSRRIKSLKRRVRELYAKYKAASA
ncbi:MAG: hypothetical protein PVG51_14065 [Desulfosarcina sp.]|jgi:hypothetical protein